MPENSRMLQAVIISGPNGAGKSTLARRLLPPSLAFVNADEIAKSLGPAAGGNLDLQAGRLALQRMDELEARRESFAVETTLASRSLAPRMDRLKGVGYEFHLMYVWLPSADLAVRRVADRVSRGGHNIPPDVIHRRYAAGLRNFFDIYKPLADSWVLYDNELAGDARLIARQLPDEPAEIRDVRVWELIQERIAHG